MQEHDGLSSADRELEEALKSLAPAGARIDSVGAAFEAGRRSARRQVRTWRFAAAAALFVGVGGWIVPGRMVEPLGQVVPRVVRAPSPSFGQPPAEQSVVMLQAAVREYGLTGLPPTRLPIVESTFPRQML